MSNTAPWTNEYTSLPWKVGGSGRAGVDCWGLVALVYLEQFDTVLPTFAALYEGTKPEDVADLFKTLWPLRGFVEIAMAGVRIGDVLTMRNGSRMSTHVSVYVGNGMMLHALELPGVIVTKMSDPRWNRRLEGAYRYESL